MKWIEPSLEAITTTNVIFFDKDFENTCRRVCEILDIDLFPLFNSYSAMTLNKGKWIKKSVNDYQKINNNTLIFDKSVIERMDNAPSNILFVYDEQNIFFGIVHFTDFHKQIVYQSLYQNFYEFETNIREYLTLLGIKYYDFEKYYEYKKKKSKSKYILERLDRLRDSKFREAAGKLANLQLLELREKLLFMKSSYHKGKDKPLPVNCKNIDSISKLRNIIMHSKDFTGHKTDIPHNYKTFKDFFNAVLDFKDGFLFIKNLRQKQMEENQRAFNSSRLAQLEKMSDAEIERFFFNKPL